MVLNTQAWVEIQQYHKVAHVNIWYSLAQLGEHLLQS